MTATSTQRTLDQDVAAVRAFNRFWTRQIGVLQAGLAGTSWSLTEARLLFELAHGDGPVDMADLRRELDLDSGYLTRVVGRLRDAGVVTTERSTTDGRRQVVRLTPHGRAEFAELDQRSSQAAAGLLAGLDTVERHRLVDALTAAQDAFSPSARRPPACVIREPRAGELGWMIASNARLYAAEYGWDASYEALVARIVADFAADHDPKRERAWVAELGGEPVGCVLCVRRDDETAQLRILLVEPRARGLGIGARLVDECVDFARRAGYRRLVLWTNDVLTSARRIYEAAGFTLVEEEPHHSFGHDLVGQNWELPLTPGAAGSPG